MVNAENIFSRSLVALYTISLLSGFSMGIFNPLISVLMEQHGVNQIIIGANASVYYLCVALFSPFASKLIGKHGLGKTIVLGICITTLATALFPLTNNVGIWFVLRAFMGVGICLYMVAGQTGLNLYANSSRRGVIVATHGAAFGIGFMISPLIGSWLYVVSPKLAFLFGGAVIFCGVLVIFFLNEIIVKKPYSISMNLFRKISVALQGAFIYGALEGIIVTLLPIILLRKAIPVALTSLPLPLFMIASGIGMIPVSYFSDKFGQFRVLFLSAIAGLLTLLGMFFVDSSYSISIGAVFLGLSLGTFFPITLAMIGNQLSASEMPAGSALFTASFSYGCAAGPLCSALFMTLFGAAHVFTFIAILLMFLIVAMIPRSNIQPMILENR
jgi:MFS family permease